MKETPALRTLHVSSNKTPLVDNVNNTLKAVKDEALEVLSILSFPSCDNIPESTNGRVSQGSSMVERALKFFKAAKFVLCRSQIENLLTSVNHAEQSLATTLAIISMHRAESM